MQFVISQVGEQAIELVSDKRKLEFKNRKKQRKREREIDRDDFDKRSDGDAEREVAGAGERGGEDASGVCSLGGAHRCPVDRTHHFLGDIPWV